MVQVALRRKLAANRFVWSFGLLLRKSRGWYLRGGIWYWRGRLYFEECLFWRELALSKG